MRNGIRSRWALWIGVAVIVVAVVVSVVVGLTHSSGRSAAENQCRAEYAHLFQEHPQWTPVHGADLDAAVKVCVAKANAGGH